MKKFISTALALIMLCAAFVIPSGALEFVNPKYEACYNEYVVNIDWTDRKNIYDTLYVVISPDLWDPENPLTEEDFPEIDGIIERVYISNGNIDELMSLPENVLRVWTKNGELDRLTIPPYYLYTFKLNDSKNFEKTREMFDKLAANPYVEYANLGRFMLLHYEGAEEDLVNPWIDEIPESSKIIRGDANLDGTLDMKDVTRIIKFVAGRLDHVPYDIIQDGDINRDGEVNVKDAAHILRTIANS